MKLKRRSGTHFLPTFTRMNFLQSLRRVFQADNIWRGVFAAQDAQQTVIKKLFRKYGFEIQMTCSACPEQYDVFKDGHQVGYFRLRHGAFRVDYPDCGGETIYMAYPEGDGAFESHERLRYMTEAMRAILKKIKNG